MGSSFLAEVLVFMMRWLFGFLIAALFGGLISVSTGCGAGGVIVGTARFFPSAITGQEAASVMLSMPVRDGWFRRVKRVTADVSAIPGYTGRHLELQRDGDVYRLRLEMPSKSPVGQYDVRLTVQLPGDNLFVMRDALLKVTPEAGLGFAEATHPYFRYQGRRDQREPGLPQLLWPGSSVEVRFRGTKVVARFENTDPDARFYALIDDRDPVEITLKEGLHDYVLAENLPDGWHELKLHRLTEVWKPCHVMFKGLMLDDGAGILPPRELSGIKLEFYGDSITAGNHAEKSRKDTDDKARMNNYLAFSARTARAFDAEFSCIAQSGIALTSRYSEENGVMDTYYRRTLPWSDEPAWDFANWQPDAVVVNLLTNDDWYWGNSTNIPPDSFFRERYTAFLDGLRGHYPEAHIFCVLGTMPAVADWPPPNPDMVGVIKEAVKSFRRAGDERFHALMFDYQHPDPGHPSAWHHEYLMKRKLVPFMEKKMGLMAEGPFPFHATR